MKAAEERQLREECERAISTAYQKTSEVVHQNADALAGFGVAGLSVLGFVALMRRPDVR